MITIVAHADWSVDPAKRWVSVARRTTGGFLIDAPEPVGDVHTFFERLAARADGGAVVAGFDFPLGLPAPYAHQCGITSFRDTLPLLGAGRWCDFFELCELPDEITPHRPFYPKRPGGTRHADLITALGADCIDQLRRRCEQKTGQRNAASPLFWTLGGQQVGRSAIAGWRDLLQPALTSVDFLLWPFDGDLATLTRPGTIVVAETYPAESGLHVGLPPTGRGWSKRRQDDRRAHAGALRRWAASRTVALNPQLDEQISAGFGGDADGEDRFDATVGVMGMLEVALGHRPDMPALDDETRLIEGWILGQL